MLRGEELAADARLAHLLNIFFTQPTFFLIFALLTFLFRIYNQPLFLFPISALPTFLFLIFTQPMFLFQSFALPTFLFKIFTQPTYPIMIFTQPTFFLFLFYSLSYRILTCSHLLETELKVTLIIVFYQEFVSTFRGFQNTLQHRVNPTYMRPR